MGAMVAMSASATLTAKTARMSAARDVAAALQTLMSLVEHLFIALCLAGRAAWLEVLGFRLVVVRTVLGGLILNAPARLAVMQAFVTLMFGHLSIPR